MSPKEAKRCCKRFYIYFVMVLATTFWIIALNTFYWRIDYAIDMSILLPILCILGILDIFYVKTKYMKYACVSYLDDESSYKQET